MVCHVSFRKNERSSLFIKRSGVVFSLAGRQEALMLIHSGRRGIRLLCYGALLRRGEGLETGKIGAT